MLPESPLQAYRSMSSLEVVHGKKNPREPLYQRLFGLERCTGASTEEQFKERGGVLVPCWPKPLSWRSSQDSLRSNKLQRDSTPDEPAGSYEKDAPIKSTGDPASAIPVKEYLVATGKEVLLVLQSAAAVIPVPMLQDAIGIALKVIELCEDMSVVDHKAKEVQGRVGHLMIVVLAHITDKNEDGDREKALQTAISVEGDIKDLLK
ncbi:hypothetical protein CVT26_003022 [Gymnopilus dilepis]|uniref:Uncharacterized protein n=1 Tax=Gymnopilus dilepis TaxID=231916 RepID=A0A409W2K9_9AGAR|nr:hypothetical protein CVT26_003022 [Gymnopilus dilepis]